MGHWEVADFCDVGLLCPGEQKAGLTPLQVTGPGLQLSSDQRGTQPTKTSDPWSKGSFGQGPCLGLPAAQVGLLWPPGLVYLKPLRHSRPKLSWSNTGDGAEERHTASTTQLTPQMRIFTELSCRLGRESTSGHTPGIPPLQTFGETSPEACASHEFRPEGWKFECP